MEIDMSKPASTLTAGELLELMVLAQMEVNRRTAVNIRTPADAVRDRLDKGLVNPRPARQIL